MTPREGLRTAETGAKALTHADDDAILAAMTADPILIERPLVATDKGVVLGRPPEKVREILRSEEHTSELQSLMRISYAVFCLKKNKKIKRESQQKPNVTAHI